jgi:hypothetical protein
LNCKGKKNRLEEEYIGKRRMGIEERTEEEKSII